MAAAIATTTAITAAVAAAAATAATTIPVTAIDCVVVAGCVTAAAGPPEAFLLAALPNVVVPVVVPSPILLPVIVVPVVVPLPIAAVPAPCWGLEARLVLQAAAFAELPHWSSATRDAAIPVLSPCEQFDLIIASDCLYFPDQASIPSPLPLSRALHLYSFLGLCLIASSSLTRRPGCWRCFCCACGYARLPFFP